jgi:hypothetical protein
MNISPMSAATPEFVRFSNGVAQLAGVFGQKHPDFDFSIPVFSGIYPDTHGGAELLK